MKDFKGQDVEIGDRIVIFREKQMIEGIVESITATKKNARFRITAFTEEKRYSGILLGATICTQGPSKTMVIERGAGLPAVTSTHVGEATTALRELLN